MLTEVDIVTAVGERLPQGPVNRGTLLRALLNEDEADLLIALRRERELVSLPPRCFPDDLRGAPIVSEAFVQMPADTPADPER